MVYGDGGALPQPTSSVLTSSSSFGDKGKGREIKNQVDEEVETGLVPSPTVMEMEGGSRIERSHSRIKSLEPSLIGFSMEDDEEEELEKSQDLNERLQKLEIGRDRIRRESHSSAGTVKDQDIVKDDRSWEEEGDESMPGSFFLNPKKGESSTIRDKQEAVEEKSRGWDGGEMEGDEEGSSSAGLVAGITSAAAAVVGGSTSKTSPSQALQDLGSTSHSAEPSEIYHSVEPSLVEEESAALHPHLELGHLSKTRQSDPSTIYSSESESFKTLSAEDLNVQVISETRVASDFNDPQYVSRRTTIKKPMLFSHADGAIPDSERWLNGNQVLGESSEEKKHYLIKEMVKKELSWELDRAWLLDVEKRENRPDQQTEEEDEFSIFQPIGGGEEEVSKPSTPSLPLLEFLLKHVLSTFPIFKPSDSDWNESHFSPKEYVKESILPLLSVRQASSLSSRVDRLGEGDRTPFSARSTLDGFKEVLQKWAVRYVTAVLRADPVTNWSSPYTLSPDGKRSISWPPSNLLPPEAFLACRKPNTNSLRHGGMEITFSSMRIRRGELKSNFAVDYMLTIKKPNRLPRYVVRNEADFEQFSIAIAKELGKGSKIKPIPPRGVYSDSDDEYEEPSPSQHPKGSSLGSTLSRGFGKSSTTLNKNLNHKSSGALGRKTSFGKSASTLVRRRSNSASVAPNPAPALPLDGKNVKPFRSGATGRSSRLRRFSVKTLEEKEGTSNLNTRDDSDLEGWAGLGVTRRGFPISSAPSTPGVDENKEINFDFSDNTAAAGGSNSQRSSMEVH